MTQEENTCLSCGEGSPCGCDKPMPAAETYAKHRAQPERFEPYCDCAGGHVQMIPDPDGQWRRAGAGTTAERDLLKRAVDLIEGDLVGSAWKRACRAFVKDARAVTDAAKPETCLECGGTGLQLNDAGEPDLCRVCKGDTVAPDAAQTDNTALVEKLRQRALAIRSLRRQTKINIYDAELAEAAAAALASREAHPAAPAPGIAEAEIASAREILSAIGAYAGGMDYSRIVTAIGHIDAALRALEGRTDG